MPSNIVTENVVAFLKNVPPFQFLSTYELTELAGKMAIEYFPRNEVILRAGDPAAESLYLVQKGAVKLAMRTAIGKELTLDLRAEGEIFGVLSVMGRDVARLDVVAMEDTICYTIPAAEVQRLTASRSEVADYFLRTSLTRYMDRSLRELRERVRVLGEGERFLYALTAGQVLREAPVGCGESATVREAACLLEKTTSLLVTDAEGRARGIVTDRDFSRKVVAAALPLETSVTAIMTAPVISIEAGAPVFQALLTMLRYNIHHLLVTEAGLPKGVITQHDMMLLQGASPLSVTRHFEQQKNVADLAAARRRASDLLPLLMRDGARASHITRVVAEINDRMAAKILQMAEEKLGPPPAPYCWVATGSEGRAEQTFQTDQDNGLIYSDDVAGDPAAEEYFARLAEFARDALVECGYPLCPGDYMATNPRWRQPLALWKKTFAGWIEGAQRRSVEDALILFDMRAVAGDARLFEELARHNRELVAAGGLFRSVLAFLSTENRPPLGFFRTFVVERTGEHRDALDVKLSGTGPIVNAARLLAMDAGMASTNTVERLAGVERAGGGEAGLIGELREAFEFLMLLRLENQLRQARAGEALDNYIRPSGLTHLQRNSLKEAFHGIARAQQLIEGRYRSAVWQQLGR